MQTVSSAWTAEEKDTVRSIKNDLLVSWKKDSTLGSTTFTIGSSLIGGDDLIGINPGAIGSPGNYNYFDESENVLEVSWEHQLITPLGGLSKSLASGVLGNTQDRYLPKYLGGTLDKSELFTSILPRRPIIINSGFLVDGIDDKIPQFSGLFRRSPSVKVRDKTLTFDAEDYIGYFDQSYVDRQILFTGQRTDQIMLDLFAASGMSTAQYELDTGLNTIPFGIIPTGSSFASVINDLAQSENGYVFQDEEGVIRFWNRNHFGSAPFNQVQKIITTSQVINVETTDEEDIINTVEISSDVYAKQPDATIYELVAPLDILAKIEKEVWINLDNPVLEVTGETIVANTLSDGTGSAIAVTIVRREEFSDAVKYTLTVPTSGYITQLDVTGRSATVVDNIYIRESDSSSLTAYQEKKLTINNKYIQENTWANSFARIILDAYSSPGNIVKLTIKAIPELQRGDLISWQGLYWRIYSIRASLSPDSGFIQELVLLQGSTDQIFEIGSSTIGGTDIIGS